nr:MAG TPA: hypothetical protein [Caudoviricetes sp.]
MFGKKLVCLRRKCKANKGEILGYSLKIDSIN